MQTVWLPKLHASMQHRTFCTEQLDLTAYREGEGAAGEVQLKCLLAAVALHVQVGWPIQIDIHLQSKGQQCESA